MKKTTQQTVMGVTALPSRMTYFALLLIAAAGSVCVAIPLWLIEWLI